MNWTPPILTEIPKEIAEAIEKGKPYRCECNTHNEDWIRNNARSYCLHSAASLEHTLKIESITFTLKN